MKLRDASTLKVDSEPEMSRVLSGHGFVRWFCETDQRVGVEFAHLKPESRT